LWHDFYPEFKASAKCSANLDLKNRNTFGFDASAELAYEITTAEQIPVAMKEIAAKNCRGAYLGVAVT